MLASLRFLTLARVQLAFSIDRAVSLCASYIAKPLCLPAQTFVFNFLCVIYDVFSTFCTLSWVFFLAPGIPTYSVFFLTVEVDLWAKIWLLKEFLVVLSIAIAGLLLLTTAFSHWLETNGRRVNCEFIQASCSTSRSGIDQPRVCRAFW